MVMEIPTPQCVGREFVRQYYTLLNKAPLHLHRFYNHDSSFLHGGLDRPGQETRPVVGQHDIHERIMQLNFRDCHAKIRQVDSLETLGDGVVVQVSGELSNNGQPMRRFMQTFVLVPQSPKKYYVRNDIFRYQDEIFTEDDNGDIDSALTDIDVEESGNRNSGNLEQDDNVANHDNEIVRNGSVYGSERMVGNKFSPPPPPDWETPQQQQDLDVESTKSDWDDEEEEELEEDTETGRDLDDAPEMVMESPAVSQEPKTYANMVSKNTSALGNTPNATSPVSNISLQHTPSYHKTEIMQVGRDKGETGSSTFGHQGNRLSRPRLNSGRSMPRSDDGIQAPRSPEDPDLEKRKPNFIHYPDAQQLFVGNLTHSITEEELKSHFNQFGKVLDMRINTKQTQKIGGGKVPNFGFIVFEEPESVQKVLSARPIFYNDHRLNVEEKKRPKDNRIISSDTRVGPPRSGPPMRLGIGGGGGRGGPRGALMPQGTGRGESRGGGMRGSYPPSRR